MWELEIWRVKILRNTQPFAFIYVAYRAEKPFRILLMGISCYCMCMNETRKTLAMKYLDGKRVAYESYGYSTELKDAEEVAAAVGFPPEAVYKTLVVLPPEVKAKPLLVMVSANSQLDLKKLAQAVGAKKLKMATHREAEQMTGLQVGGISALALTNKRFVVYIAQEARQLDKIVVSGGERGWQIRLGVEDLVRVTLSRFADVAA